MYRVTEAIKRLAKGREIVLYGCSKMADALYQMLEYTNCKPSFIVDKNFTLFQVNSYKVLSPDVLSPQKHFPVIVPFGNKAVSSIQENCMKLGYSKGDWFVWYQETNYDIDYNNITLGKHFQLSKALIQYDANKYIRSVGRYCSINHTLRYGADHAFGISTSSLFPSDDHAWNRLEIGHDVWIGANTFINCSKVKYIGNGAVIGTGAVVLEDVPPYAVVVGVPGKIIKYRFKPNQIELLEKVQWWNWEDEEIRENMDCFMDYSIFFKRFGAICK